MYFIFILLNISFIYKCNNNVFFFLTKTEVAKSTMFSIRVFVLKSEL